MASTLKVASTTPISKQHQHQQNDDVSGYASDATTNYEEDSDGESWSGSDLDEVERIARVVRPQFVSDDSIYTPVVSHDHGHKNNTNNKETTVSMDKKNRAIIDYRQMTQQKAKEELLRATGDSKSATSGASSPVNKKEIVPEIAKTAFQMQKDKPAPAMISLDITALAEKARKKKQEAEEEERRQLASLSANNNNSRSSNNQNNSKSGKQINVNKHDGEGSEIIKAESKYSAPPSELARNLLHHHQNQHHRPTSSKAKLLLQQVPQEQKQESESLDGATTTEQEQVEELDNEEQDRDEYYRFLDAIVKNNKDPTTRRTFAVPFEDESHTAAAIVGSDDIETRYKAIKVINERDTRMYAALARIGTHVNHDFANYYDETDPVKSQHHQSFQQTNAAKKRKQLPTIMTSTGVGTTSDSTELGLHQPGRVDTTLRDKEFAFQEAKTFLEGMLLQEEFIDAVNALLDKAVPAFQYTKYTRQAGEFTLEQHRQWELFCQSIEKMVLKKLHRIMDVSEFFERVFDEDDDDDANHNNNNDDEEEVKERSLSHDAWELILAVMKFEAFCSLMDSYVDSATELEMEDKERQEQQQEMRSKSSKSSTAATSKQEDDTRSNNISSSNNSNNKIAQPRRANPPKATLFHALPRAAASSSQSGEHASAASLMQRQKQQAPRSAGGSSATVSTSSATTTTTTGGTSRSSNVVNTTRALGARSSTNRN